MNENAETSEVVVAKALLAYDRDETGPGFLHIPWEERSQIGREEYLRPARAVLAELATACAHDVRHASTGRCTRCGQNGGNS